MSTELDALVIRRCREAIRIGSKSFSLASLLLPPRARDAVAVVYAWCRRADDAIDEVPVDEQRAALARQQREVESIYAGEAQHDPVLRGFQTVVRHYGIPRAYVDELLNGLAMDARAERYETVSHLLLYCYRVAGVVGLMMCHVLGIKDPGALARAAHLGIAMQLTNICRDVEEDWRRGRLYVPRELVACAIPEPGDDTRLTQSSAESLRDPMARLLAEADRYYASADVGIAALGLRAAMAVRLARYVYSAIGAEVARRGYDPNAGRAVVSTVRKLALLLRTVAVTFAQLPSRLWRGGRLHAPENVVRFQDAVLAG